MKYLSFAIVAATAAMFSFPVLAIDPVNAAYVVDASGNVVHSSDGRCWRNGSWTWDMSTPPCDPRPAEAAVAVVAQAPVVADVAPVPAPAPAAPVMAPVVLQKFSLSAKELFDFDKSVLRPESLALLDKLLLHWLSLFA